MAMAMANFDSYTDDTPQPLPKNNSSS